MAIEIFCSAHFFWTRKPSFVIVAISPQSHTLRPGICNSLNTTAPLLLFSYVSPHLGRLLSTFYTPLLESFWDSTLCTTHNKLVAKKESERDGECWTLADGWATFNEVRLSGSTETFSLYPDATVIQSESYHYWNTPTVVDQISLFHRDLPWFFHCWLFYSLSLLFCHRHTHLIFQSHSKDVPHFGFATRNQHVTKADLANICIQTIQLRCKDLNTLFHNCL